MLISSSTWNPLKPDFPGVALCPLPPPGGTEAFATHGQRLGHAMECRDPVEHRPPRVEIAFEIRVGLRFHHQIGPVLVQGFPDATQTGFGVGQVVDDIETGDQVESGLERDLLDRGCLEVDVVQVTRALACELQRGLGDVESDDLAVGECLGDEDRRGAGAASDVSDTDPRSPTSL